ncbi:hypothetical protein E4T97_05545 [Bacteroides acidifaciens]|uniref:Uncharacterized protein n=1 Tax=Bacteroides acidifaciens TaxID=85831 RepID=A0A8H0HT45_9BACE|nr:hypothetical protein E4T97_05545 [Bacteroides acidifaciens]
MPACHGTEGVGSLIPHLPYVGGKGVLWNSKLGHGGLTEITRKQYGKCKTSARRSGVERHHHRPKQRASA